MLVDGFDKGILALLSRLELKNGKSHEQELKKKSAPGTRFERGLPSWNALLQFFFG